VNILAVWMKNNHKVQRGVAESIGISTSSLHDILRKNQMPSLKVAYQIELYTEGDITLYDWIDQKQEKNNIDTPKVIKNKPVTKTKLRKIVRK